MQGLIQKLSLGGSAVFVVLVLTNIVLFTGNRSMQAEVNQRAQYLQESLTLERIYQPLVRGLAELAATRGDQQIKQLLNEQGISFQVNPAPNP